MPAFSLCLLFQNFCRHNQCIPIYKSCSARAVNGKSIRQVNNNTDHESRPNLSLLFAKDKIIPTEWTKHCYGMQGSNTGNQAEPCTVEMKQFTASFSILQRDHNCSSTKNNFCGFVELDQTDTGWYKNGRLV